MISWFDMPSQGLSGGGEFEIKELTATENKVYETPGEVYNKVTVNVEGGGSSWETVFEGSVTTEAEGEESPWADLPEVANLSADTIKVTFNGVEYTCEKQTEDDTTFYGAPLGDDDWSEYPFIIDINPKASSIETETAGTYTLKIEEQSGGGSSDFSTAEVTINWDPSIMGDELTNANCPVIWRDDLDENAPYIMGSLYVTTSPVVVEVPLYKGKCYWDYPHRDVAVTGNIEELSEGYLITGDCTINIS